MRRTAQRLAVSSLLALVAAAGAPAVAGAKGCSGADSDPASLGQPGTAHATLCLLNRERRSAACASCAPTASCAAPPTGHARDMVAKHYFDHDSPSRRLVRHPHQAHRLDPLAPLLDRRREHRLGRRLARHAARDGPGWMHSAGHRANILARQFKMIGIGVADGAPDRRRRRDLRHRFRRLTFPQRRCRPAIMAGVARGEAVRRRQAGRAGRRRRRAGDPVLVARRGACSRGRFGVPSPRVPRWRRNRSTWSSSTATRPGWTRPRSAARCATTRASATRGCWRSPSPPRAGWPTRCSTPAPTTTCTARSPARS